MKLLISKEELIKTYEERINKLAEENEFFKIVSSEMVSNFISKILSENNIYIDPDKIDELYSKKVYSLYLTPEQWQEEYANNTPKILELIYGEIERYLS